MASATGRRKSDEKIWGTSCTPVLASRLVATPTTPPRGIECRPAAVAPVDLAVGADEVPVPALGAEAQHVAGSHREVAARRRIPQRDDVIAFGDRRRRCPIEIHVELPLHLDDGHVGLL